MGCLRRLGCLALLVILAIAAYLTRDRWMHFLPGHAKQDSGAAPAAPAAPLWQALTPDGAKRARAALAALDARNGPAYARVGPGDLAAYIFQELSHSLPSSADSIEAAAIGNRLYLRAVVRTADLGGKGGLGPIGALLGDRERVQLGGTLRIVRAGLAELRVQEFRIHDFSLPESIIPRLIGQMSRGTRPEGLSPDGIALRTPEYIGDVRVANGLITLYKAIPATR